MHMGGVVDAAGSESRRTAAIQSRGKEHTGDEDIQIYTLKRSQRHQQMGRERKIKQPRGIQNVKKA